MTLSDLFHISATAPHFQRYYTIKQERQTPHPSHNPVSRFWREITRPLRASSLCRDGALHPGKKEKEIVSQHSGALLSSRREFLPLSALYIHQIYILCSLSTSLMINAHGMPLSFILCLTATVEVVVITGTLFFLSVLPFFSPFSFILLLFYSFIVMMSEKKASCLRATWERSRL